MQQLQKRCFNSLLTQHLFKFLVSIFKIYFLTKFHIFLRIPNIISCSPLLMAIFKLSFNISNNLQILYNFCCRYKSCQQPSNYVTFIVDPRVSNIYIEGTRMCTLHLQMLKGHDVEIFKIAIFIYHEMEHSKDSMHNAFCS